MRERAVVAMVLFLTACSGGPSSPDGGGSAQSDVNSAASDIKVNGIAVAPGSTTNVTVGTAVGYQVNYTNNSGQTLHTALAAVRDDGVDRVEQCGASGSGGGGGGFGSSKTIFANDSFYTPGRTVRWVLFGALGPAPTGSACLLGSIGGPVNRAAVQAERLLATLAIQ